MFLPARPLRTIFLTAFTVAITSPAYANDADDQESARKRSEIVVTAQKVEDIPGGQFSRGPTLGVLGDRDLFETPISTKSFTAEFIADQFALTSNDLAARDASFTITNGVTINGSDGGRIRGFRSEAYESSFDGYTNVVGRRVALEFLERVDIIKGPSSLLTGIRFFGGAGGTINYVSKKPLDTPLNRVSALFTGQSQLGAQADVSRRFGAQDQFGARVNLAYRDGETAIDDLDEESRVAHIAFNWRGDAFNFDLQYGNTYGRTDGSTGGYFYNAGVPIGRPPNGSEISGPDWDNRTYHNEFLRAALDVRLSDSLSAFAVLGTTWGDELFIGLTPAVTAADGTSESFVFAQGGRNEFGKSYSIDTGLRGKFATGPIGHSITLALGYNRERFDGQDAFLDPAYVQPIFNIYDPQSYEGPSPALQGSGDYFIFSDNIGKGLVLVDEISLFDERLLLTAGVRYTDISIETYNYGAPTPGNIPNSNYQADNWSPSVAALFKITPQVAIYGNYFEAVERGAIAPTTAVNAGTVIAPGVAEQYEAGIKGDFGRFGVTAAVFDITRPSSYTDPDTLIFGLFGQNRHRGFEFDVFGEPVNGLRLYASYAYLDAEIVDDVDPALNGNTPVSVPDHVLVLGFDGDVPGTGGLALLGNMRYVSRQFYDQTNDRSVPGYTVFDAGLRYRFALSDTPVVARLNVSNLFDKDYFASTDFTAQPGAPRTVRFSLSADF